MPTPPVRSVDMTSTSTRREGAVVALLGLALLAAACTGYGVQTTTTTATTPVEAGFTLDLSPEQIDAIVANGRNQTGRTDLTRDDWVRIAARVCEEGAWTADVQQAIVTDEGLDLNVPASQAMVTLLQIGVAACPELRPPG